MLQYRYEKEDIILKSDRYISDSEFNEILIPFQVNHAMSLVTIGNYFPTMDVLFQPIDFNGVVNYKSNNISIYIKIKNGKFEPSDKIPAITYHDKRFDGHFAQYFFEDNNRLKNVNTGFHYNHRNNKIYEIMGNSIDYDNVKTTEDMILASRTIVLNGKMFIPSQPTVVVVENCSYNNKQKKYYYSYNGIYSRSYNDFAEQWIKEHNKHPDFLSKDDLEFMALEFKFNRKHYVISI